MNTRKKSIFTELKEIIFWQQLNKQVIQLRESGSPITEVQQKNLKRFCFNENVYPSVSDVPLLNDLPLILLTDLESVFTVTIALGPWINLLRKLFPNMYLLDIETALADTFTESLKLMETRFKEENKDDSDWDDSISILDKILFYLQVCFNLRKTISVIISNLRLFVNQKPNLNFITI